MVADDLRLVAAGNTEHAIEERTNPVHVYTVLKTYETVCDAIS